MTLTQAINNEAKLAWRSSWHGDCMRRVLFCHGEMFLIEKDIIGNPQISPYSPKEYDILADDWIIATVYRGK